MIEVIGWSAAVVALALLPFYGLMAAVVIAAVLGGRVRARRAPTVSPPARFLVVIPAHDEEAMIAKTVRNCRAVDYDPGQFAIHVIADNCSDRTADQARGAGAFVFERSTPDRRSKGHALQDFFETIPEARPGSGVYDAAAIIDADTEVDPDLLNVFADSLAKGQDWVQAYYTVSNADASWRTRLMTYAFSLANGVWMAGLDRLGLGVGLKGNGMCFSRQGLIRLPWQAHGLVEDMEFALMLRQAGERVRFRPDAIVRGEMVSRDGSAAVSQRIRWEAGRKALRAKFRGPLAASSKIAAMAKVAYLIDLQFPPLGLLAPVTVVPGVVVALASLAWGEPSSALIRVVIAAYGCFGTILVAYALSPVFVVRLPWRYFLATLSAPRYLLWKLAKVAGRRPRSWVRTPREAEEKPVP